MDKFKSIIREIYLNRKDYEVKGKIRMKVKKRK